MGDEETHMRKWISSLFGIIIYLAMVNLVFLYTDVNWNVGLKIVFTVITIVVFMIYQIRPYRKKTAGTRLNILMGGNVLMLATCIGILIQSVYLIKRFTQSGFQSAELIAVCVCEIILTIGIGFLMAANGFIRIMMTARQLKLVWRILWIMCWWIPPVNLFITMYVCKSADLEYKIEIAKKELDEVRAESEICNTRYPVLLVHGVFFRDWQYFNYWGRIPAELQKNGCRIYYGKHQSAAPVSKSAQEIKEQIQKIVEETGCGKVNIIAHSKGGLDARYAIDCLDAAPMVASLTTINTPHKGCLWVDQLLEKIPKGLIDIVALKYNAIFLRLGDKNPDFTAAVMDLTADHCCKRNQEMTDSEDVLKQSVMSLMSKARSASFPLNIGFCLVKSAEGANDGLVSEESAKWGNYQGTLTCSGCRGISHGDMIDLFRENISGFDVREYYVKLVQGLKEQGL